MLPTALPNPFLSPPTCPDVLAIVCDELDKKDLSHLSRTCRPIHQHTIGRLFKRAMILRKPSRLKPFVRPGSSLPRPYLENITTLILYSTSHNNGAPNCAIDLYPALSLPNITYLQLLIEFDSYDGSHDRFGGLANILPCLDPKYLSLQLFEGGPHALEKYRCPTFSTYTQRWTRLEDVTFPAFEYVEDLNGSLADDMAALLYESVALLKGSSMVEDLKPHVLFCWTDIIQPDGSVNTVGMLTGNCSLLRLPSWMEFQVVISPGSSWFTTGAVERWSDEYCPNKQLRDRVMVTEWDS